MPSSSDDSQCEVKWSLYDIFTLILFAMSSYIQTAFVWCCSGTALFSIIAVIMGIVWIIKGANLEKQMTEEKCLITDISNSTCTFDCHCTKDEDGEQCATCHGLHFVYETTASAKCRNLTLYPDENVWLINGSNTDPGCLEPRGYWKLYSIGTIHKCWVEDCDKRKFVFDDPEDDIEWGNSAIISGSILCFISCCCAACCACASDDIEMNQRLLN